MFQGDVVFNASNDIYIGPIEVGFSPNKTKTSKEAMTTIQKRVQVMARMYTFCEVSYVY